MPAKPDMGKTEAQRLIRLENSVSCSCSQEWGDASKAPRKSGFFGFFFKELSAPKFQRPNSCGFKALGLGMKPDRVPKHRPTPGPSGWR